MHRVIHKQAVSTDMHPLNANTTEQVLLEVHGCTFEQVLFGHHYCSLLSSKVPCSKTGDRHGIICMEA